MSIVGWLFLAALVGYALTVWHRGRGASKVEVARGDLRRVRSGISGRHQLPAAEQSELFAVQGRHEFDHAAPPRQRARMPRQRGGVTVDVAAEGEGRVRNVNAPCWLCGQKKTPNHKCT
jgi:hypothetical protein